MSHPRRATGDSAAPLVNRPFVTSDDDVREAAGGGEGAGPLSSTRRPSANWDRTAAAARPGIGIQGRGVLRLERHVISS